MVMSQQPSSPHVSQQGGHSNATLAAQPMALYQLGHVAYAEGDSSMGHMMGFQPQVVANQPIQEQSTVQQKMPVP